VGGTIACQKTMENFFIKKFILTMDPLLIVLLKHI